LGTSIDGLFETADVDREAEPFDLFGDGSQTVDNTPVSRHPGLPKKTDGIVPPTPPPSARGQRKGPGLDLGALSAQLSHLTPSTSNIVPPTPPPSARGTKPPLSTLNLDALASGLDRLVSEDDSSTPVSTPQPTSRPDRSESFDIEALSESFGANLTSSTSSDDIYDSFTSPTSSNQGAKTASRTGGLPSVLEAFDPFTDDTPTTTSSPVKSMKSDPSTKKKEEHGSAPDPGEIDDELPKSKNSGKTRSAIDDFHDTEKAKERAQEAKRQVGGALEAKLNNWEFKDGTQKNIRTLLTTLDTLLWEGSGWKKPPLTELTDADGVRRVVRKARLVVHPDKVQNATTEQQVIADRVFDVLNSAFQEWEKNQK